MGSKSLWIGAVLVALGALGSLRADAASEPRWGRAIIAGVEGAGRVETPEGGMDIEEGMALSHGHAIVTGGDSSVCALLTPGALICVHAHSRVDLVDLQHVLSGLPRPGDAARGRVVMELERGALYVHGAKSPEGLDLSVRLRSGVMVEGAGAEFIVGSDKEGEHLFVEAGEVRLLAGGEARALSRGQSATVRPAPGQTPASQVTVRETLAGGERYNFAVCRDLFDVFIPLAADFTWEGFERAGPVMLDGAPLVWLTRPSEALDLSPTTRQPGGGFVATPPPIARVAADDGGQRRRTEMWAWYRGVGVLRGFNYLPRNAVNSIEMWQAETFDAALIEEELGWARGSGLNAVRVFLPFDVWRADANGLRERFDTFLGLAADNGLKVVPVLFDDLDPHGNTPAAGPQPAPVPGVNNSRWTPSPGLERVRDRANAWPELEAHVTDLVKTFRRDDRVLFWDLYNDPGRYGGGADSLALALDALKWARAAGPTQPLSAGIHAGLGAEGNAALMQACDLVTFSAYESRAELEGMLAVAALRGRPVICTGWLERTRDLTFNEALPLFAERHVGWFHWGLVAGRSQKHVPVAGGPTEQWPQALLRDDGTPYDENEVALIRRFTFQER